MDTHINEFQRQAILALIRVEAARVGNDRSGKRTAEHLLFALVRERFGVKYSVLPDRMFREAAHWLLERPLA